MNLATNQRALKTDRTNVCMCHLDHLLQLPWAQRRRVPPTEAARPKLSLKDDVDCGASKASSCPLYDRLRANAYARQALPIRTRRHRIKTQATLLCAAKFSDDCGDSMM
jgi:hypothetical protein